MLPLDGCRLDPCGKAGVLPDIGAARRLAWYVRRHIVSVEQPATINAIGEDTQSGLVHLTVSNHLPWSREQFAAPSGEAEFVPSLP